MERYSYSLMWLLVFVIVQVLSFPQPPHTSNDIKNGERDESNEPGPCNFKGYFADFMQWGYPPLSPESYGLDQHFPNENNFDELQRLSQVFLYHFKYYEKEYSEYDKIFNAAFQRDTRLRARLDTLVYEICFN